MIQNTDNNLGDALGQLYVSKYFTEDAKKRIKQSLGEQKLFTSDLSVNEFALGLPMPFGRIESRVIKRASGCSSDR